MPTASAAVRGGSYGTTYGTSYSSSTVRSSSASRRTSSLSNGYTSSNATSQYRASRPLPSGPGPLDSHGKRIDGFTALDSMRRPRGSPVGTSTRVGPLKVDYSTVSRYSTTDRTSDLQSLTSKNSRTSLETTSVTTTNRLTGRRSASLANLRLDDNPSPTSYSHSSHASNVGDRAERPRSKRESRLNDDDLLGGSSSIRTGRAAGINSNDDRKDSSGIGIGHSRYTSSSLSRDSSPGTSSINGVGSTSRGRSIGDSHTSSLSSASSTSAVARAPTPSKDGGRVGLRNLGNTCFMNSVLQCLSNTRPLLEWCLNDSYLLDINTTTSSMKGALVKAFAALMKSLWKEPAESYVSPNAFKTQIQKFAPRFVGYAQQDSQEFLRYLLEGIHEDVNRVLEKPKPMILDDNRLDSKNDKDKAKEYWNAYIHRDHSHIVDIFVGQLKSELKFTDCGHRSITFDPFWDLSLPIPKNQTDVSLDDCLKLFMREEELEAEERPMCSKCKMRRSCTKSFSIHRFPRILVIHLKRFSQERYGRKLTTLVDFPVKGLNLAEYSSEGGQKVTYDLYAVSDHSGSVHSGHYTAICKNPYSGEWFTYNDTRVTPARSNQALSTEAYLLFYEQTAPAGRL